MKYSEFEKLMENAGYKVRDNGLDVTVLMSEDSVVSYVAKDTIGVVDLDWLDYTELPIEARKFIADNCMELTFTDLEDREEEEKFKLKQKGITGKYLIWIPELDKFTTGSSPFSNVEGVFTQSEIDDMPECYTHPAVWEKIKVESEEQ